MPGEGSEPKPRIKRQRRFHRRYHTQRTVYRIMWITYYLLHMIFDDGVGGDDDDNGNDDHDLSNLYVAYSL